MRATLAAAAAAVQRSPNGLASTQHRSAGPPDARTFQLECQMRCVWEPFSAPKTFYTFVFFCDHGGQIFWPLHISALAISKFCALNF